MNGSDSGSDRLGDDGGSDLAVNGLPPAPTDAELQEKIVRIVHEEHDFEQQMMLHLSQTPQGTNDEGWSVSSYREPKFIQRGITALHRKFDNVGRRKARTAAIMYGFEKHREYIDDDLQELSDLLIQLYQEAPLMADRLQSGTLEHERKTGSNSVRKYYIRTDRRGLLEDIAEVYGLNFSQLVRHYIAVCISDADMGQQGQTAEDYKEKLWKITDQQQFTIEQIREQVLGGESDQ